MPSTDKGANLETQDRTAGLKDVEFDSATKRFQVKDFSLSIWALIISNSIPVVGAIVFSWDVGLILTIYWMENIVLGFYNVIKMWMAKPDLEMVGAGKKSAGLLPGKIFIIGLFYFPFRDVLHGARRFRHGHVAGNGFRIRFDAKIPVPYWTPHDFGVTDWPFFQSLVDLRPEPFDSDYRNFHKPWHFVL